MSQLNLMELAFYFTGWTGSVLYSMYKSQVAGDSYSTLFHGGFLSDGWKWLGRKKDTSDFEWDFFTQTVLHWLPYVSVYLIISSMLRTRFPRYLPWISMLIASAWMYQNLGLLLTTLLVIQPVIFLLIMKSSSLKYVWILCLASTIILHSQRFNYVMDILFQQNYQLQYLFSVTLAWTQARSISYVVDTSSGTTKHSFGDMFYFCFYLPLLPTGPLMRHVEFQKSMERAVSWTWKHLLKSFLLIGRMFFWWLFHDFALHYCYHTALQYHPSLVESLDIWSAAGLGYSLGQFFMIKYLVLYGLPSSLAQLDHVDAPPGPKCIGRIHLYSQMWRDFDRGLYNFMLHYIYIPSKGTSHSLWAKLRGSALTFIFVCIWHGSSSAVIAWTICNYFGICLETVASYLVKQPLLTSWKANLSEVNWIRLKAAVAAPLFLVSILSNFCFFTDITVGEIFTRMAFIDGGFYRLSVILFIVYCGCHVSLFINSTTTPRPKLAQ